MRYFIIIKVHAITFEKHVKISLAFIDRDTCLPQKNKRGSDLIKPLLVLDIGYFYIMGQ